MGTERVKGAKGGLFRSHCDLQAIINDLNMDHNYISPFNKPFVGVVEYTNKRAEFGSTLVYTVI